MMRLFWVFGLVGWLAACEAAPDATQGALQEYVGKDVSTLSVQDLDGAPVQLKEALLLAKKPVLLNVWATWCTPCLVEMPTLDALGKTGELTVIAVATDQHAVTIKDFLKKQNWGSGLQVWHDPLGRVTREALGARGIPATYLLRPSADGSLTVVLAEAGERNWVHASMLAKMRAALKN